MNQRLSMLLGAGALALAAIACGGKTETGGPSTGGSGGSGAGPVGGTGAMPYGGGPAGGYGGYGGGPMGGYGGGPIGGYGGGPIGGYGGMPAGGYGGGPDGGYGGMPVGGYGGMGGGPPCVGCKSYKLGGIIEMKACCGPMGACGGFVDGTISALMGVPPGCYEINQPGTPDPSCPPWKYPNPLDGGSGVFPGCCRPQSGTCGYFVDATIYSGPNFGCIDSGQISGMPPQPCGTTDPCSTCLQAKCSSELSACLANSQCASIVSCMQSCSDSPCANKCYQSYPGGQGLFTAIEACVGQMCSPECG